MATIIDPLRHPQKAASRAAWHRQQLARHDLDHDLRAWNEGQLAYWERRLRDSNRCLLCGRALEDPHSQALHVGPECRRKNTDLGQPQQQEQEEKPCP